MIACELSLGLGMRLRDWKFCCLAWALISSATSFSALGLMALGCVRGLLEGHANLQCTFFLGATETAAHSSQSSGRSVPGADHPTVHGLTSCPGGLGLLGQRVFCQCLGQGVVWWLNPDGNVLLRENTASVPTRARQERAEMRCAVLSVPACLGWWRTGLSPSVGLFV